MAEDAPALPDASGGPWSILDAPDRRDGRAYLMPDDVGLAVRVALATGRPLLLRGDPGSGKSSLAASVARERGWRYYEKVVTSRTQAQDLLWSFDTIRRLADAQLGRKILDYQYVEPGVLWWAFARESAHRRGAPDGAEVRPAVEPQAEINALRSADHAVVLIDEIDKADPDLPNGLLVPLGGNEFTVTDTGDTVRIGAPEGDVESQESRHLVVITTNDVRELPQAFLRRCIVVWLQHPDRDQLVAIARKHFDIYEKGMSDDAKKLAGQIADAIIALRELAEQKALRRPSTAEFLDALHACRRLSIKVDSPEWQKLQGMALLKQQQPGR